ncbi:MAG: LuxR C-terminal-related transcriptional regulator [Chloroflexota bacterium]
MTTQILTSKLFIPPPHANLVSRTRLLDRLEQVWENKLTIISAPAGFGKTTLLSEWISQCENPICWLSLDERDNDLRRFLHYFITALKQVERDLGEQGLSMLQSPQPLETEDLLTGLIGEIERISQPFAVVLDDYHLITEHKIQQMLIFLLDHQPKKMHLVISGRADPPWPTSRLRIRGDVLEMRSQEMRFSMEETAIFLHNYKELALSQNEIAALEKRTEGWIAGLQMAAISMIGREDVAGFIQSFTGSHRFVMDYLMEEVLDQQSPEIRDFLLKTAILERLTAPLCDAVVGRQGSQAVLLELEKKNLFLTALDDQRRWYRYHHLFGDLLSNHLQQTEPDAVLDVHRRAGNWYQENGLFPDAVKHAIVINDIERIVQLTDELAVYKMNYGELNALMAWLDRLPKTTLLQYPWLLVVRSWALFNSGKYDDVELNLREIEKTLSKKTLPEALAFRMRGHMAALRSYLGELREDGPTAIRQAEDALALLPEKDIKLRSFVAIRWANGLVWYGDFEKAIAAYKEAGEASKLAGDSHLAITALSEKAVVQMFAGKLSQAVESMRETCNYAEMITRRDGRQPPAVGILFRHMSMIKRERNELAEAEHYAQEAVKLSRQWGEKEALIFGLLALVRVQFSLGKYEQAEQNLDQILRTAKQISPVTVLFFQNWVYHLQIHQGKTEAAQIWADERGFTASDEFGYQDRFEYHLYARLLAARGDYAQALKAADALLKVVVGVGDLVMTIQIEVLRAIILDKMNKSDQAMAAIGKVLSIAGAEGYVRSIIDEGEEVRELLKKAIAKGIEVNYASKLLAVFEHESRPSISEKDTAYSMLDQLSSRELEALRLLVTEMTAPEIADEMIVSVSTVRTHIKNIYSKLDVHSRHEAVTKAKELKLL